MKKILKIALALSLIAGISLSLSYALLTDSAGPAMNIFTSSRGIDIKLREPAWDGYDFDDPDDSIDPLVDDWQEGLGTKGNSDSMLLGYNIANEYLPGDTVPKDPQIKNMTDSEDTYVAMQLTYFVDEVEVSYATFATYLQPGSIDFNTGVALTEWTDASNTGAYDFFVYNDMLEAEEITLPLFDEVLISFDLVPDQDGYLPKLEIDIDAYAVQTQLPAGTTATDALYDFSGYELIP